ncbi:MAG: molybdopterin molybdotransferase MoeA [Methanobrevibacter sp.]|uniref:molybdopterin molybdotransferase MoeA n=1 Tax=Methanobrevibacter sp. TaxID=66852 RepID=UPI0025E2019F|nr:gephyrin-like molybdotransferase Glp [Methanobrevibacter sp.]MBQ8016833.1 molybdopterin molybdotransferase MoeA [Methanobrevibacter sp.]MBR1611809.1 molybdopterin molybdotransferase MoeA [Methanobrevibacter sp.]
MFLSKLDSLSNARNLISDNQKTTDVEEISIWDAHKRVLAEDIMAFHDSPPFDKSAMDGFALIAEDTFGASNSAPKELKIIDAIGAGDFSSKKVGENEAIVIATGAPIPDGANAVLMKEYTTTDGDDLTIYSQVTPGENVSPKSEDIKKGQKILDKNTFIRYQELGLIASAGYDKVKVYKKPRVKIIITGNELVEPTKDEIDKAKIINSNQFTIKAMVEDSGAICDIGHAGDSFDEVKQAVLDASVDYDVIMTTGGTAISKGDVVLDVVDDIGEILFHGVAIRPGKPAGAGIVNNKMIFTFSGQPVAAMSQFDMFARKYLFEMQGRSFTYHVVKRISQLKIPSQLGRTDFIRAVSDDEHAKHVLNRGSGIIRSMVEANSYIIIDENDEGYQKDDIVDVVFFDSLLW